MMLLARLRMRSLDHGDDRRAQHRVAIGEKAFHAREQLSSSWYWDEPLFSEGSDGTVRDDS